MNNSKKEEINDEKLKVEGKVIMMLTVDYEQREIYGFVR